MPRAHRHAPRTLLLICLLLAAFAPGSPQPGVAPARAQAARDDSLFFFPNFAPDQIADLALVGSAQTVDPRGDAFMRLTGSSPCCQTGAIWHRTKQNIGDGFETTFDFRVSNPTYSGADGFAFVIQNDPSGLSALGLGGCSMGYAGIRNSLAVEFDTFANPPYCETNRDPNGNHVGVMTRGAEPNSPVHNNLDYAPAPINMSDGKTHTVKIRYTNTDEVPGQLVVFFDGRATATLTVTIDIAQRLELSDGRAWVGLVAGTGTIAENHDIGNWHFVDSWDLTCLEYDFSRNNPNGVYDDQLNFIPDPPFTAPVGAGISMYGSGWRSNTSTGRLQIVRGIGDERRLLDDKDGFPSPLLALIRSQTEPAPIQQIRMEYVWVGENPDVPLAPGAQLEIGYQLELNNSTSTIIEDRISQDPDPVGRAPDGEERSVAVFDLDPDQTPAPVNPTGLRVWLQSQTIDDSIRLKTVSLCIDAGAPERPPALPLGSAQACNALLANIKTRFQPFGPGGAAKQPEFQFPNDVTLKPYAAYSLNALDYPPSLRYAGENSAALVPCVYQDGSGAIYNPSAPGQPIVRFTAIGGTATEREQLVLLNYAAYFSVGSTTWCYPGDNAFGNYTSDSVKAETYGPAYNIPSPKYDCKTLAYWEASPGPCGSFAGSLFRAMGYYNVAAFAEQYDPANESNPLLGLNNLYYGVVAYQSDSTDDALPDNVYGAVRQPFVRQMDISSQVYNPVPVEGFKAVRAYPVSSSGQRYYGALGFDPIRCSGDKDSPCGQARRKIDGLWDNPFEKEISPESSPTGLTAEQLWKKIQPGDIQITIIESVPDDALPPPPPTEGQRNGPTIYSHIQVVVGWGPPSTSYAKADARYGVSLYPAYSSARPDYVPYVMDRFSLPGTGGVSGPRPFNYFLLHTANDFWVRIP